VQDFCGKQSRHFILLLYSVYVHVFN